MTRGTPVESVAAAYLEFAASSPALYEVMFSLSLSVPFDDAATPPELRFAFYSSRNNMHTTIPLSLAVLVSVGIIVIGCFYLTSPQRILGGFGLKPPAPDPDTQAWLRLKGIRDVASGLAVLTLMLTSDSRTVGIVLLVFAIIPFGDMSNILASGGRRVTAFSVHGLTCAVMLFAGLLLIHAI